MRWLLILLPCLLAAETGGLQSLPFPPGTDIERAVNVVTNGNFNGSTGWSLSNWQYMAAANQSRTNDGSGSIRVTNRTTETFATQTIPSATLNQYRIFRLRAWLRASQGTPAANSTFRVYLFQRTSARFCGSNLNLATLTTTWVEYTATLEGCEYLHTYPPQLDVPIEVRLGANNIPSGVQISVDDVSLTPIVRPMVIFPTYPNYRGMLWPDQGSLVKWNAVVDPPDGETLGNLKVQVQVVRASDSQVLATVEASSLASPVSLIDSVWYRYSVTPMQYEAGGLADGVYLLRGRLMRISNDAILYTYPDYKIVKEAPAVQRDGWKVWVDRYNRTVLDGKPRFIWGTYASFTGARNTFPTGASVNSTNPDNYRALAGGCDSAGGNCNETLHRPVTHWNQQFGLNNSTIIKQWADVGLNSVAVYAAFGTYDVGFSTPVTPVTGTVASGTISSSGTSVTGSGTQFGTQILGPASAQDFGDVIRVNGRTGTGTLTASGNFVTGTGTQFLTQLTVGDRITASGSSRNIERIDSNTLLELATSVSGGPSWSGTPFTYDQYRKVTSVGGSTSLTIDRAFTPNVSGSAFSFERCATGGARYTTPDRVGPFLAAIQDYGMWYWHVVSNIGGVNSSFWTFAPWTHRCSLVTFEEHTRWLTRFRPMGEVSGFLGYYTSDEPSYAETRFGVAPNYEFYKGHREANMGGMSFWVDGVQPKHAWDQWNNFADSWQPDPYPAHGPGTANGANPDDFAYGMTAWQKHGRSWGWPRRSVGSGFEARPVHIAIQLFAWTGLRASYPNVSDSKIQAVSSIAAGAHGLLWWATSTSTGTGLAGRDASAYRAWRRVSKYVQGLLPILDQPIEDLAGREDGEAEYGRIIASVSDPAIKCSTRRRVDQRLLACANTTDEDKTVTITLVDPIDGVISVPWDDSTVTPSGATTFSHTFRGLNGGSGTAGAGTLTGAGPLVNCTGCDFQTALGGFAPYENPTVRANNSHRIVLEVNSPTTITIESTVSPAWNHPWTYSPDADKAKSVEVFVIQPATASSTMAGDN